MWASIVVRKTKILVKGERLTLYLEIRIIAIVNCLKVKTGYC